MDLDHEREMERLKQEALDKKARMTAEQLMAVAAGENLDSQAAVKFAESFSAGKNAEQVQQAADARIADSQRHEDRMLEMMREMKDMATTMTGHIVQNKDAERDRYRERMERQEDRVDKTQDSALEYATRNNQQAAAKPQAQAPQSVGRVCPDCGTVAVQGVRFCATRAGSQMSTAMERTPGSNTDPVAECRVEIRRALCLSGARRRHERREALPRRRGAGRRPLFRAVRPAGGRRHGNHEPRVAGRLGGRAGRCRG